MCPRALIYYACTQIVFFLRQLSPADNCHLQMGGGADVCVTGGYGVVRELCIDTVEVLQVSSVSEVEQKFKAQVFLSFRIIGAALDKDLSAVRHEIATRLTHEFALYHIASPCILSPLCL